MRIRDAAADDLPAIVAIYNDTIPGRMATADTEPVSVKSRLPWFREHNPRTRPLWVMEVDLAIAGWLSFQSFYGRPAYHKTAEVSVYVSSSHRRRGIAWRLLSEAINRSPSMGLTRLVGYIFAHNEPSLQLFDTFGFQRWGYLPGVAEIDGIERDLVIVGLRITDSESSVLSMPT